MGEAIHIPQMETIQKTAEIFGLPPYFVRQKAISGEIVCVKAGRKYLVNVEKFAEYLNTAKPQAPENEPDGGGHIQPIPLRLTGT